MSKQFTLRQFAEIVGISLSTAKRDRKAGIVPSPIPDSLIVEIKRCNSYAVWKKLRAKPKAD